MTNYTGNYSYSIVDEVGVRANATLPVTFADTATLAQLASGWAAMEALVQAIVGGSIQKGRIMFNQVVSSPAAPAADSRVEEVGVFNFGITGSTHRQGIAVPAFLDSKAPLDKINLADTDVAAFTAAVAAAITGGGSYTTPEGLDLTALVDAFFATRKHRRQLRSLTYEVAP
jgi:hypothetical protein